MNLICGMMQAPQGERNPGNPDLQLRLSAGPKTRYESFIERDEVAGNFSYEFVVPTKAIPSDGLRLDVLDAEADGEPEMIGGVRLPAAVLAHALESPNRLLTLNGGAVSKLEVVVGPYTPLVIPTTRLGANIKPTAVAGRPLIAGEVARIHTTGSYTVGRHFDEPITPAGYPHGAATGYNFEQPPFASAPHACAIALIGAGHTVEGVVVGTERLFLVAHSGSLRIGLNDTDPENNEGWFSFDTVTRAPSTSEWLATGEQPN